jgi:hypothetical protein
MIRAHRIALAAGGLLTRTALGFIGLTIVFSWYAPSSGTAARSPSEAADPDPTARTVMLRVPDGAAAAHLTIVDASGRELAVVTKWRPCGTSVVSRQSGGTAVSYHLNVDGSAKVRVQGATRATLFEAESNGKTEVSQVPVAFGIDTSTAMNIETLSERIQGPPTSTTLGGELETAGRLSPRVDPRAGRVASRSRPLLSETLMPLPSSFGPWTIDFIARTP